MEEGVKRLADLTDLAEIQYRINEVLNEVRLTGRWSDEAKGAWSDLHVAVLRRWLDRLS